MARSGVARRTDVVAIFSKEDTIVRPVGALLPLDFGPAPGSSRSASSWRVGHSLNVPTLL
jgi:hypothetical protein